MQGILPMKKVSFGSIMNVLGWNKRQRTPHDPHFKIPQAERTYAKSLSSVLAQIEKSMAKTRPQKVCH